MRRPRSEGHKSRDNVREPRLLEICMTSVFSIMQARRRASLPQEDHFHCRKKSAPRRSSE